MFSVNVAPDMSMYTLLISQGYDPSFALCEFIDNAIHAHQENTQVQNTVLKIKIRFFSSEYSNSKLKNSIVIDDNGPGISEERLKSALKPAKVPNRKGLSEFGIGMKAAAVWFADEWKLDTWPKDDGQKLSSTFNLTRLLEKGQDTIDVKDSKNSNGKHGTRITLRLLRRDIKQERYEYICKNISEIYQRFISGDIPQVILTAEYDDVNKMIEFDNKLVPSLISPKHVKKGKKTFSSGKEKKWKVAVNFPFNGHQVKGYIHLRNVGSYINNPGLVLFRHNRVICGITKKKYIPLSLYKTSNKARAMRVYGELDIDDYPVSYTKDKYTFDDDDFVNALVKNVEGLEQLLLQADNYRKSGVKPVPEDVKPDQNDSSTATNVGSEQTTNDNSQSSTEQETGLDTYKPDDGSSNGGSTNDISNENLNNKLDTKIKLSNSVVTMLNKLGSKKHTQLYNSLCKISLVQHPALMYVGAWTFFESLARLSGCNSSTEFVGYFNQNTISWGFDKGQKKSFTKSLKDISENGNCTKHCGVSFPVDAKQLANDFEVLEPLVVKTLELIIAN